jgi:DNA polymerase
LFDNIEDLEKSIVGCEKCGLCKERTNIVFGTGNKNANIMLIGEGPGADEDKEGIPFVGKAGQLMNKAFEGLGFIRENVYIANIVKCRPPQNRVPLEEEAKACMDYLRNQVMIIRPKIIVLLGSTALKNILGPDKSITAMRGKWIEQGDISYLPTWHPAALLRDENKKIEFWEDLKLVREKAKELNLVY